MLYRLRYAWTLWRNVRDLTLREALTYPTPDDRGDPEEDALEEIDAMSDSW
jgi:hypothetical protein